MSSVSRSMSAIPPEELPILEALINIRNRLTALKKNSSDYIRAHDVQTLYQAVIKQVTKLNAIRDEREASEPSSGSSTTTAAAASNATDAVSAAAARSASPSSSSQPASSSSPQDGSGRPAPPRAEVDASAIQTNRVDTTLQDVFSLLSLFFLTIGKSRETPAIFSQLSSMKQLLDHLAESGIYTEADLQPFAKRLAELREIIQRDREQGKHPSQLTKLMLRKLEGCEKVLQQLQGTLSVLSVELVPVHQKIVSIRRQIVAAAAKPKPARQEIRKLQDELRAIDGKRVDGKFLGPGGSSVPAGQAILVGLLEECFEICHDVVIRNDEVPMTLQPIYDRLTDIKGQLEHLVLTHRWTLRETDLWNYQVTLKEIDRLRVDGKFVDSEGKQPEGQLVLLYLLRRCYGLIYRLVASSEPISEELMPISNKLSTVSRCLKEVSKYGGPFTTRDLYPYRLALHQIENMKSPVLDKEGNDTGVRKWLGADGSVPEGQAILRAQFEEVEQTINEMLNREDESDDDEEVGSDDDWGSEDSESYSDEEGGGSDSGGIASGIASRNVSLPTSPAVEPLAGSPGIFSAGGVHTASPLSGTAPSTPQTARPPEAEDVLATPTQAGNSEQAKEGKTAGESLPQPMQQQPINPLPPGAATLAVPIPGQTSLTAAAISLDSMTFVAPAGTSSIRSESRSPPSSVGTPSSSSVVPEAALPSLAGGNPLSLPSSPPFDASTGASVSPDNVTLSESHDSTSTAQAAKPACGDEGCSGSHPVEPLQSGQDSKEELARQLEAKLAMEQA